MVTVRDLKTVDQIREGEFYTPRVWVEQLHELACKTLGSNWYNEWVVWDPACGLGQLTEGYKFKELYCSTLHEEDINFMIENDVNPEAYRFQYDFLNDDPTPVGLLSFDNKLERVAPKLVQSLSEGKPLLFLQNPPYATDSSMSLNPKHTAQKAGATTTKFKKFCVPKSYKLSCNLYIQFILREIDIADSFNIQELCFINILPAQFYTNFGFERARIRLLKKVSYVDGFAFDSAEFMGAQGGWPVSVTILKSPSSGHQNVFLLTYKERDKKTGIVSDWGKINFYNICHHTPTVREWVFEGQIRAGTVLMRQNKSPQPYGRRRSRNLRVLIYKDEMFHLLTTGTNAYCRGFCGIWNSPHPLNTTGWPLTKTNFWKVIGLFAAWRIVPTNIQVTYSEICTPYTDKPGYDEWLRDAFVYSLFSMKMLVLGHKKLGLKNGMFWLSRRFMYQLALQCGYNEMCEDILNEDEERFAVTILKDLKISPIARKLINSATNLIVRSMPYRKQIDENPKLPANVMTWDANLRQLRDSGLIKQHLQKEWKDFLAAKAELRKKLYPGNYEFGFFRYNDDVFKKLAPK